MSRTKPRSPLSISPTPFKSSLLAIPPSPFSPRTPFTPLSVAHKHAQFPISEEAVPPASEAPLNPLAWIWSCHQCHRSYRLGVTRRCLDDGHYFCSGTTTTQDWRKRVATRSYKRHKACTSEFEYQGWKAWSRWKKRRQRNLTKEMNVDSAIAMNVSLGSGSEQRNQNLKVGKDCWNQCSYPSECRWGKNFGIHTPVASVFPNIDFNTKPTTAAPIEQEAILKLENCKGDSACAGKSDVWKALMATAKRHTITPPSSPLGLSEQKTEAATNDEGDLSMAAVISSVDKPSSPATSDLSVSSNSTTASAAVDMFKDFMCGKMKRRRQSFRSSGRGHGAFVKSLLTVPKQNTMQEEGRIDVIDPETYLSEYVPLGGMGSRDGRQPVGVS